MADQIEISPYQALFDEDLAKLAGFIATVCFTLQYLPQAFFNFRRKSVRGFSSTGILIKQVGASFLLVNSLFTGENIAVVMYGLCNVIQHSIFMVQFAIYPSEDEEQQKPHEDPPEHPGDLRDGSHPPPKLKENYLWFVLFPVVPTILALVFPHILYITNSIKPITQVASHIPQLQVCFQLKTTAGVSLSSQHLNIT